MGDLNPEQAEKLATKREVEDAVEEAHR